ncbi:PAS domain S-box protein [Nostoc sp. CALU 1950]|uniref:PAS domain S-box protein n=1 Tax=Nostoc sp. CALU 1950 TaxID=3104321 RepID=UPI003EB8BA0E
MQQLKQLQEQQKLIGAIALDIHKSLKLQDILAKSVQEVRQLLKSDRVLVYQFTHQMRGKVVAESVLPQWMSILGLEIEDTCFQQSQEEEYRQGKIWAATNIYEAGLSDCCIQLLEQFQVKANLVIPILLDSQKTPAVELWGLFIVHQCSAPRQWQTFEVEFFNQLRVQLAIAIQQAQLYHNLQTLNAELEAKVQERTAKLQESDRRFYAIFNNTFQFTGLLTPDGILLEANQTALSFGGIKLEDVINRPFWEAHWWTISPQTQEELKQAIARASQGEFVRYEVDVLGANNRVATIDFSLRPLQNETDQVILLIPEGRDITDRKATELALHEREVMLYLIGDNLPNGAVYRVIRELDGSDRFSYLSGGIERLTEVKTEDALRDSSLLYRQFIPEDIPRLQTALEESRLNLSVFDIQLRIRTPSGQLKWLHFRSTPRQMKDGRVAWDGLVVDVTDLKRTEETLRKSQALLEESQRVACLGNWEFELGSGKITWSKGLFDLFNREPALLEPNYEENLQLYHPEDREKLHQAVERAIATGESYKEILRVPQPDGSNRYFEGIGHTEFNADGQVIRLYGTAQDVTEREVALSDRQKAEAALAKNEEQLRLTLEFNHIGLWDWNVQTREVLWNDNHFRLLGLEPETLIAKYQLWRNSIHPEDVDRVERTLLNALAQHTNYEAEYRVIYPDSSIHWLTGKGRGVYNEAGEAVRMLGVIIDITDRKQAEAALRESEARFQAFMNNSPVLAWITDTDGHVLYLNRTYLRTFKLLPEQVIGRSISDLYPDEIARQHFDHIRTVTQTNQVLEAIEVAPRPDGSLGEFLVYKFPILGFSAQKLVGRVAIDITERKILERELAHKQKLLDAFINSAPVGITILDRKLRFSFINEALAEINGIPAAAHIGKTLRDIVPDLTPKLEQLLQHVLTTGEPILDVEITGETPKLPGVIRTWLASYFPIQSEVDEPISIGIVVVETSDVYDELRLRKRAEQMLELQAVITRNMAEGICLVRATDGVFVYTNPKFEQMFGYEPGELIGQHVSIVNYGDERTTPQEVNQAIKTAVIQHDEATYEVQNVKKDGTPFWSSATTSVFGHPEYGSVLVAVQQDITEQKQAKEKIKASLKEKEVLLKEIHHRVKNNLGIVSSLLQMQCRRTEDPVVRAILRDSQNRIASIALVHEKLYRSEDLADIDFAQYIPDLTTHLFDSYNVSSSQIQLNIQVDNANLDIETAIPCGLIINELVSNALKYAFAGNRGGEIEVKFYQESEGILTLIIRDNGIGLPENFDGKKAKTLGITLVQGLVKQLRGKLEIDSQQGTQFKITFANSRG